MVVVLVSEKEIAIKQSKKLMPQFALVYSDVQGLIEKQNIN